MHPQLVCPSLVGRVCRHEPEKVGLWSLFSSPHISSVGLPLILSARSLFLSVQRLQNVHFRLLEGLVSGFVHSKTNHCSQNWAYKKTLSTFSILWWAAPVTISISSSHFPSWNAVRLLFSDFPTLRQIILTLVACGKWIKLKPGVQPPVDVTLTFLC